MMEVMEVSYGVYRKGGRHLQQRPSTIRLPLRLIFTLNTTDILFVRTCCYQRMAVRLLLANEDLLALAMILNWPDFDTADLLCFFFFFFLVCFSFSNKK